MGVAVEIFSGIRAFAAYGFCKAHAASFARIAYQTAFLKAHYPAEFLAGILSCQPMGFYPSNVILEEARRMGIGILGVDINRSEKKFSVEDGRIRIGLMQVKGISESEMGSILEARRQRKFTSLPEFFRRTRVDKPIVENLINCGAFGPSRRRLLWSLGEILGGRSAKAHIVERTDVQLFGDSELDGGRPHSPDIPEYPMHVQVRMDYDILGLSSICHPMVFYRQTLSELGMPQNIRLRDMPNHSAVKIAGVVVVCMRPPTKSGVVVVFITLEDETGLADVVVFPKVYDKYGSVIYNNSGLIIEGRTERSGKSVSIIAEKISPLTTKFRNRELEPDARPYSERTRSAGQRSWVKGQGV